MSGTEYSANLPLLNQKINQHFIITVTRDEYDFVE